MNDTPSPSTAPSGKKTRLLYYVIPLLMLAGGFAIMQLLAGMNESPPRRQPALAVRPVQSEVIVLQPMPVVIEALGRVASSQPVQLFSEVNGVVETGDVPFTPAQRFRKGQVLLRVDDRQAVMNLNSSKSDFLNALASVLPELKIDFPREFDIWQRYFDNVDFSRELAPLPEATNRNIKLLLTRAQVYRLYYTVKNLEIILEKHIIRAPFDGSIISTNLRAGSSARAGAPVGELINLESMEIELPLPTPELQWISTGQAVRLEATDGRSWTGRIIRIAAAVDKRTQTVPVFVAVAASDGLIEGMYISARIPGRMLERATLIPRRAVYDNNIVYIVQNGALLEKRVDIIGAGVGAVMVRSGLADGDTLVTELLQGIAPGMAVIARLNGQELSSQ
jgi:membrane fusion protein, multidrug efflux system